MADIKVIVAVVAALLVGAVIGGLIGHFAVPSNDPNVPTMIPKKAQCVLQEASTGGNVAGTIMFERNDDDTIMVTGAVSGLSAGQHGFHVHQVGRTSNGCKDAKGMDHGAPTAEMRHVGDLGNIEADSTQTANVNIKDSIIKFAGDANILGRAIVIHAGVDDLGLSNESDSKTTGHAGARLACCVIGVVN
uniref:Superoxide dismutase [Cu-Zn] n=1 Tax=Semibalanus balanoides TaxID=94630 RepID=A0A6C0S3C8_SEMBA|nr:superoxide dismutase [Semibalanus balanoides]